MSAPEPNPLRERFRQNAHPRLAVMGELLDRLEANRGDGAAAGELLRHFHYFAGLGGTCGLPRVSAIGASGEEAVSAVISGREPLSDAAIGRCRALLEEVELEVSR